MPEYYDQSQRQANVNLMGQIGTAAAPESGSLIRDGITQAEQYLSDLHGCIDMLEKRLDTVLSPVPPTPAETNSNPMKTSPRPTSHFHGRLNILNEGFGHAALRLRDLYRRIEV